MRSTPTTREVAHLAAPVLVVSMGSWEQHGAHLPLDTDTRIADELADRLVRRLTDSVRGPSISVSSSGEHADFAGTLSVGGRVVTDMVVELVRSAHWASGIVIVNGHGGNVSSLTRARDLLESEGRSLCTWSPPLVDPTDSHAGYVETSLMMAIDPATVREDEIRSGPTIPLGDILDVLRDEGLIAISPNGVLGDPRSASAAYGRELLASWEEILVDTVEDWRTRTRESAP